jgi:predicted GH43/DUF377 family glycosyl hydrolase
MRCSRNRHDDNQIRHDGSGIRSGRIRVQQGRTGVALALTTDFRTFERCGLVMQPDDKDAALLPRRINGRFALLHRPWTDPCADIWISFSPDLRDWSGHRQVPPARRGSWWDANRIEARAG